MSLQMSKARFWLKGLLIIVLVLGVFFRFASLDHKVYWHDEAYTSLRAAGYTRSEIDQEIFQNQIVRAADLQKFQRLKPGSTAADTVRSLAQEDPQHPPLYFLIARVWMQQFGSSLTASRSLPALLSLLSLPLLYGLAMELFALPPAALWATVLLSLSPFDILFAQTARQYSLLTVAVIASHFFLLRALRRSTLQLWAGYSLSLALGFYCHPLFGLTVIGHGVYILGLWFQGLRHQRQEMPQPPQSAIVFSPSTPFLPPYMVATTIGVLLYAPWLWVLQTNQKQALSTTDWTRITVEPLYLAKLWLLSFTALFLDLDFGFNNPVTYLLRLPLLVMLGVAFYWVYRHTPIRTWLLIVTSVGVPFLLLALPDLLVGGKRSTVSRYLISCYPGLQLSAAYLIAKTIATIRHPVLAGLQRGALALLLTGSLVSCTISFYADTWWDKDLSYANGEIARRINTAATSMVVSDVGNDFTNTGDLLSLSYLLHSQIPLLLLRQPFTFPPGSLEQHPFVFRPSESLRQAIAQQGYRLEILPQTGSLWQVHSVP
ncbi:MAG: glycosyltransferase family 39 protein [Scytolyngbya sp. HA4215-MV1]|jgi:uncharacterized membrane protein|nr:glycosyltransferase family 39 protein [Scytolyngbya sp. HA4215-MV1]